MGFNWNFKPKTINGFNSQPVDTLNPQVQPQPIQMSPVGLRGNETWRNQYNMPQTQRAAYMDEYEADQKWNEQPAELMQKADDGRISALENEIATLKQRIQENTAKLKNWTGNADQIAAIEARKINSQDPTEIWRWKEGIDQQKIQRQQDMERIAAEKKLNDARNKELNQYKIEGILKNTMPFNAKTRDELMMMQKSLNDAEELAKQYKDVDMLKKIEERRALLEGHEPVGEKSNRIESEIVKNLSMVGKKGGMTKKEFIDYVNKVLTDNEEIWRYNPGLQQKLYQMIGAKTPSPKGPFEL